MSTMLGLTVTDGVATLTLDRPPVNAFNAALFAAFAGALDTLAARGDWCVLHIRSALSAFSAGADLTEISARLARQNAREAAVATTRPLQQLCQRISDLPQVSLAEIAGAAVGGGFELALGCDLRIAANEARIGLPEAGLGLLPGGGGTQRLTWLAGAATAARIILAADVVDGKTARELGMVQWAVPRPQLADEARKIATRVAGLSPLSLAACKVCMRLAGEPERDGFAAETEWSGRLMATEDTQRRVAAFLAGVRPARG